MYEARLHDLLCECFDGSGLRRFVTFGAQGSAVGLQLPGSGASLAEIADIVVHELDRRGLVITTLVRMRQEFPHRARTIDLLIAQWSAAKTTNHRPLRAARLLFCAMRQGAAVPRFVGFMMVVGAIFTLAFIAVASSAGQLPDSLATGQIVTLAALDVILGTTLLVHPRRSVVIVAAVRLMFDAVVLTLGLSTRDSDFVVLPVLQAILSLILLGHGRPGVLRPIAALVLLAIQLPTALYLHGEIAAESLVRSVRLQLSNEFEPGPVHKLTGVTDPYSLQFPSNDWYALTSEATRRRNPEADRWVEHASKRAFVTAFHSFTPGQPHDIDTEVDRNLALYRSTSSYHEVVERMPLRSDPQHGRVLHIKQTLGGIEYEMWRVEYAIHEHTYQINALTTPQNFLRLSDELRSIIESFTRPEGESSVRLQLSNEFEPGPVHMLTGVADPYSLQFPSNDWYALTSEATRRRNPQANRFVEHASKLAVVAVFHSFTPGQPHDVDTEADSMLAFYRGMSTYQEVVERIPLRSDPQHGRVLHVKQTLGGVELEMWRLEYATYEHTYQINVLTHPQSFPGLSDELRSIVESFTRPEQDLRLPTGVHIESAGVQTGRAAPYTIEAPNERWHVTDATHKTLTGSDIDLSLVRPERAAYAIVTSEPISAEKNVDDLTADLVGAFKRAVPAVEIGVVAPSGTRSRSFHLVLAHEGYPYECDIEVVIAGTRAFVVRTGARTDFYRGMKDELAQLRRSFRPSATEAAADTSRGTKSAGAERPPKRPI